MGIFCFRKQKSNNTVDVYDLFSDIHHDGRDLSDFVNGRSRISFSEFHAFDVIQHFDMMVDSIELIMETKYPKTFFSRYRFAIEKAEKVCDLDRYGFHGQKAKYCLEILRKYKVDIVNAFLKRSYEAGKLHAVKNEIIAERSNIPRESYEYFCQLLNI